MRNCFDIVKVYDWIRTLPSKNPKLKLIFSQRVLVVQRFVGLLSFCGRGILGGVHSVCSIARDHGYRLERVRITAL